MTTGARTGPRKRPGGSKFLTAGYSTCQVAYYPPPETLFMTNPVIGVREFVDPPSRPRLAFDQARQPAASRWRIALTPAGRKDCEVPPSFVATYDASPFRVPRCRIEPDLLADGLR